MLLQFISFSQENERLIIGDEILGDIIIVCPTERERLHSGLNSNQKDSVECKYIRTFNTNQPELFYQTEYNLFDKIVSEGPVRKFVYRRNIFSRKSYSFIHYGIWKEYDYLKNEIRYYEDYGVAHNKSGPIEIKKFIKSEKLK